MLRMFVTERYQRGFDVFAERICSRFLVYVSRVFLGLSNRVDNDRKVFIAIAILDRFEHELFNIGGTG